MPKANFSKCEQSVKPLCIHRVLSRPEASQKPRSPGYPQAQSAQSQDCDILGILGALYWCKLTKCTALTLIIYHNPVPTLLGTRVQHVVLLGSEQDCDNFLLRNAAQKSHPMLDIGCFITILLTRGGWRMIEIERWLIRSTVPIHSAVIYKMINSYCDPKGD